MIYMPVYIQDHFIYRTNDAPALGLLAAGTLLCLPPLDVNTVENLEQGRTTYPRLLAKIRDSAATNPDLLPLWQEVSGAGGE